MKELFGLAAVFVFTLAAVIDVGVTTASPLVDNGKQVLGAKQCTWGPTFWCSNLSNAKSCNAVRHCIQTVWETNHVPADNDSICQICKDMVTQARDQLRSNETMEELKEVFDGSCNLIPIKIIKKECCKLADNFIPELVEALSSQMNPDQVCSVAGLCNNAEIDRLLMKYYGAALEGTLKEDGESEEEKENEKQKRKKVDKETKLVVKPQKPTLSCGNCHNLASLIVQKLQSSNRDDILENILHLCGELSSFADACSSIVLTYFNDIYDHLNKNLDATGICHLSGSCVARYHQHPEDPKEEEPIDLMAPGNEDVPCELCEQLVQHLREVLIANTTEIEFKQVLQGLCNQTKGFRNECLSIVDQYYDVIYKNLVNGLDANGICFMMGICPHTLKSLNDYDIMPLLPAIQPAEIKVTIRKKLGANEPKFTQEDLKAMVLPIDKLMGAANPGLLVENGELCTLCEYILHFIQEELATPSTADQIKHTVDSICNKLPKSLEGQCHNFVDMYGDAVIALLIQGLDPREVCPKLQMCPPNHANHEDIEVFAPIAVEKTESDKPTCPLCLFAVEQAQMKIKDNKSKKNIKDVLDHLCGHLPQKLKVECVDFVETYSSELIDKLISDLKPQEICVDLKLCPQSHNYLEIMGLSFEDSSEESDSSNKVVDDSDEMPVEIVFQLNNEESSPNCLLCEELVKLAEKRIHKYSTKDEVKKALDETCEKLHVARWRPKCHKLVDKYGDKIAGMILKEMEPKVICIELGLCIFSEQEDLEIDEALKYDVFAVPNHPNIIIQNDRFVGMLDDPSQTPKSSDIVQEPPTCVLCEFVMTKLEMDLKNKTEQKDIKDAIEKVCHSMPKTVMKSCNKFVEEYADAVFALLTKMPPKDVCKSLKLCLSSSFDDYFITNEIVECGVCYGAAMALLPYSKQHSSEQNDNLPLSDLIAIACENLPAKYYETCSQMVRIYGRSIMHLSERDEVNVCAEIGKCFHNEKSSSAFVKITA